MTRSEAIRGARDVQARRFPEGIVRIFKLYANEETSYCWIVCRPEDAEASFADLIGGDEGEELALSWDFGSEGWFINYNAIEVNVEDKEEVSTMKNYTGNINSATNQQIKAELVNREIKACISDMAEHLFTWDGESFASWDEWDNLCVTTCPDCGKIVLSWDDPDDENNTVKCPHCGAEFDEEPDGKMQEIFEYWIVTDRMGEKLRDLGEPVFDRWGGMIWGRTCSGQAIACDSVIDQIAYDMGILEGMPCSWADHVA